MKRLSVLLALLAATSAVAATTAFAGGGDATAGSLATFGTGKVTIKGWSAKIVTEAGQHGGIYRTDPVKVADLGQVKFKFKSDGDVQGGAPRWSIPIDTDGNRKTTEGWAFFGAANCGATVGPNPQHVVTTVSTSNSSCKVFFSTVSGSKSESFDNWSAFAAAHPDY